MGKQGQLQKGQIMTCLISRGYVRVCDKACNRPQIATDQNTWCIVSFPLCRVAQLNWRYWRCISSVRNAGLWFQTQNHGTCRWGLNLHFYTQDPCLTKNTPLAQYLLIHLHTACHGSLALKTKSCCVLILVVHKPQTSSNTHICVGQHPNLPLVSLSCCIKSGRWFGTWILFFHILRSLSSQLAN